MEAFSQAVEGWHDYYLMIGTTAATHLGFLFLCPSLCFNGLSHVPYSTAVLKFKGVIRYEKY